MKLFGFGDGEPLIQSLRAEGTANIAMAWDSDFVVHIEYNIPLKMLGESLADLNNKKISIGWKLKENSMPANNPPPVRTTSRIVAVPAGTRPPLDRNVGTNQNDRLPQTNTIKLSQSGPHTQLFCRILFNCLKQHCYFLTIFMFVHLYFCILNNTNGFSESIAYRKC